MLLSTLVALNFNLAVPIATVDDRYLSFALDTAQLVGGKWWDKSAKPTSGRGQVEVPPFDFSRPELIKLTQALAPAYFRVGGSEADLVAYEFPGNGVKPGRKGFESRLVPARWDALHSFVQATGTELAFTLNAGPGTRDRHGQWTSEQAQALFSYTASRGYHVAAWELGNEVNAFWLLHGLRAQISARQYAKDYGVLQNLLATSGSQARVAGPTSAYWPVLGEPLSFFSGIMKGFLKNSRKPVDVISWHFYPTQSHRCAVAVRRASAKRFTQASTFDAVAKWARKINMWRDRYQPGAEVWMTETGPAQCGGEPGLSDRFISGLWWLDELGLLARFGTRVVARQTLVGSDYGMIDSETLAPNPDYWNSLLWKRLMGSRVLDASPTLKRGPLRVYAHCTAKTALGYRAGSVTVLVLNPDDAQSAELRLAPFQGQPWLQYLVTAGSGPFGKKVLLNGQQLELSASGDLPQVLPMYHAAGDPARLTLTPQSYAFITLPAAQAAACAETALKPSSNPVD